MLMYNDSCDQGFGLVKILKRFRVPSPESESESASLSKTKNYLFNFYGRSQPSTDRRCQKIYLEIFLFCTSIEHQGAGSLEAFFIYFYLYIYPPDSQESAGGAIRRASNNPNLFPEMPRYCCPLEIFNRDMTLI